MSYNRDRSFDQSSRSDRRGGFGGGGYGGRGGGYGGGGFGGGRGGGGSLGSGLSKPTWDLSTLPKIDKHFYRESPITAQRPTEEIKQFYIANQITVKAQNCPKPILTFQEACFPGERWYNY